MEVFERLKTKKKNKEKERMRARTDKKPEAKNRRTKR